MWDLADQPDLRTAGATPTEIRAFLAHESRVLRALDPSTPMTVSWSDPAAAADPAMIDLVDVVSLTGRARLATCRRRSKPCAPPLDPGR